MRRRTRTLLSVLAALALVGSALSVTAVGVGSAAASDGVTVKQSADGSLVVRFDESEYEQRKPVLVTISAGNESVRPAFEQVDLGENATHRQYEVPTANLPNFSLAAATVTVSYNGSVVFEQRMDLRYLRIATGTARFDGGRLAVNVTSAGLGGGGVAVRASRRSGEATVLTGDLGPRRRVLRFRRGPEFAALLTPPANVTLSAASGGPPVRARGRIDLAGVATSTATLVQGTVTVASPLLVAGRRYDVTVSTTSPAGTYVTTAEATEGRALTVENEYLSSAARITASVSTARERVLRTQVATPPPLEGEVGPNGTAVIARRLPPGTATLGLLGTASGVRVLDGSELSVRGSTASLPGIRLRPNGTYALAIRYESGRSVVVRTGGGAFSPLASVSPGNGGNETAGPFGFLPDTSSLPVPWWLIALLVLAPALAGGTYLALDRHLGPADDGAPSTRSVSVSVIDQSTGSRIEGPVDLEMTPRQRNVRTEEGYARSPSRDRLEITGGEEVVEVPTSPVHVEATYNGVTVSETAPLDAESVSLRFAPVDREVTVRDETGDPIPGATVTLRNEGESTSETTDDEGTVRFRIPVSASDFEVSVSHEKFEPASDRVGKPGDLPESMRLVSKTGTIQVQTTVDGDPTDAVDLTLRPEEEWARDQVPEGVEPSGDAVYDYGEVPVGTYELVARVDLPSFGDVRSTVTVEDGESMKQRADVPFRFDVDDHRSDVEELRADAASLVPSGRVDTAIQSYYAGVVEDLADTVESFPSRGVAFAETGVDPETATEGILDAGSGVVTVIDNALNTKQNVDLFNACVDMRDADVEWDGYDAAEFFELARRDRVDQHAAIRDCIEHLEDVVAEHRDEVTVVSPAQDVLEELRDFARSTHESDGTRNAALAFVVLGVGDAVESLFERPPLLERLNRSIY